jgi:phage-related protein
MIDISTLGATLLDRTITNNEIVTVNDWLDGATHPTFIRQQDKFKTIILSLIITAGSEEDNMESCSTILNYFKGISELTFEDIPNYSFDVVLESHTVERMKPAVWKLTLTFKSGYSKGAVITLPWNSLSTSLTFNNNGNAPSPFILTLVINDAADIVAETITVNGEQMPFKNLEAGHTYVFNSGEGTFYDETADESALNLYDGYVLPKIKNGTNTLTASWDVGITASLAYYPQYI